MPMLADLPGGDWWWWLLLPMFLAGFARGFAGFGVGLILMPPLSLVYGPQVAVPLIALIDIPVALLLLRGQLALFERRDVLMLFAGALLGIGPGIVLLLVIDPDVLRTLACIAILAVVAALALGWRLQGAATRARTLTAGFLSGFMEGTVSLPAPPVLLFWVANRKSAAVMRANAIVLLAAVTVLALPGFALGGLITEPVLVSAATFLPVYLLAGGAGYLCRGHISEKYFVYLVLFIVALGALGGLAG